jgi:Uma2 family endonuclease
MPELPDAASFDRVPDWVCEVLSRSTENIDRDVKLPYYAEHGVREKARGRGKKAKRRSR